jgi:uncharacterized protein VirK/YbjX
MPSEAESSVAPNQRSAPKEEPGFWESVKACACFASSRGVRYSAGKAWSALRVLFSLRQHLVVQKLLSDPQYMMLIREQPLLPLKYASPYVALGLSTRVRRSILSAHYQFLRQKFRPTFLDSVLGSLPLWLATMGAQEFQISIDFPYSNTEGDLQLVFRMDGTKVYKLIFVFASGRDFDLADDMVIAVTNIQGAADFDRVKLATRKCHDIQPAHMLMAALSGLADATNISTAVGFHGDRQISRCTRLFFSYEDFYDIYGEKILGRKMHRMPLPHSEKPVSDIQSNHRKRSLRKRRFKADIRAQVSNTVAQYLTRSGAPAASMRAEHRVRL